MQTIRGRLVHAAFEALYHQFAWAYDGVSGTFFRGEWRAWQRAALAPLAAMPGAPVLEVGLGTGDLQADLRRAGYAAVGVDRSPQMLCVAGRKARRRGAGPLRAVRAAAQALPFPTGHFAAAVSTFPSEYIVDPRTLAEIARVLRPGGRLVIVPAGVLLPVDVRGRLLEWVAGRVYGTPPSRLGPATPQAAALRAGLARGQAFGPLLPNLAAAGFRVAVRVGRRPTSLVLLVVADKPAGG